jgi:hypothetical protein
MSRCIRTRRCRDFLFLFMNLISNSMMETVPLNMPGLSRIHDSILKSGKSVHVLPGDEVILHPTKGFLVMNRRYTPWEMVDTPDPFFNLPADGYNSGRFIVGLANQRERERRFNAFEDRSPPVPPPLPQSTHVSSVPPPTTAGAQPAEALPDETSAPPEAPPSLPTPPRARGKAERRLVDGGVGVTRRKRKKRAVAEGAGGSGRALREGEGEIALREG